MIKFLGVKIVKSVWSDAWCSDVVCCNPSCWGRVVGVV